MAIKRTEYDTSTVSQSLSSQILKPMSPDSIFSQKDEGEATAIHLDQDKLQLVINAVDMLTCKNGLL